MTIKPEKISKNHYFNIKYDTKERWSSYWHQINQVIQQNPQTVLEIGIGNKIVSSYLKNIGIKVTTCDINSTLKPDIFADVRNLPFKNNAFDVVLCAEVLEHLPFKDFSKALNQIYRVSKRSIILTLPHFSITNFYFGIKFIPYIPKKELHLNIDFPVSHKFLGEHYWEIGKKNYSLKKIKAKIEKAGFKIEKSFTPKENPRHHFFLLIK